MNNKNRDKLPTPVDSLIQSVDYNLELPTWSLDTLKSLACQLSLPRPRSLAWAILLDALPAPDTSFVNSVNEHRMNYEELKKQHSTDPRNVMGDDPLSQNDESAWNQHFCDMELKALILQDVVRTFPDELYFRDNGVQTMMVNILFIWSRSHSHIGYRQGMHEVLAPLLHELFIDRKLAPPGISALLELYLEECYLEHDSFMLFSAVLKGLERFYTTGDVVPTACGRLPTSKMVHHPNEVVRYLYRVRNELLMAVDPELAARLQDCHISLELFGIRWLRLLFGREFPRNELPLVWGFIFADGPALPHLQFIIVAMLVAMRDQLLAGSSENALSTVMRGGGTSATHVCRLALHLRAPALHPRPPPYVHTNYNMSSVSPTHTIQTSNQNMSISNNQSGRKSAINSDSRLDIASNRIANSNMGNFNSRLGMNSDAKHLNESITSSNRTGTFNSRQDKLSKVSDKSVKDENEGYRRSDLPEEVSRSLATLAAVRARLPAAAAALASALPGQLTPQAQRALAHILQLASLVQCRNHALVDVETALEAAEGQTTTENVGRRQLVPITLIGGRKNNQKESPKITTSTAKEVPLKVFHEAECVLSDSKLPCLDPLKLRTD